jgi:hypothetical protein
VHDDDAAAHCGEMTVSCMGTGALKHTKMTWFNQFAEYAGAYIIKDLPLACFCNS